MYYCLKASSAIMSRIVYKPNQLIQLGQLLGNINRPQLSTGVYQRIKSLSLLKHGSYVTHRGCRGGSRLQRNIQVIVSQRNFITKDFVTSGTSQSIFLECSGANVANLRQVSCKPGHSNIRSIGLQLTTRNATCMLFIGLLIRINILSQVVYSLRNSRII